MMSRMFKGSVAILAMTAILGMPVTTMAQTAADAPAAAAPAEAGGNPPVADIRAPAGEAATALPQVLADLALGDLSTKTDRRGALRVSGKLADGATLKAMVDNSANGSVLRGAMVEGDGALPQALSDALIPQAVRDQQIFAQFATISGAFAGERGVMVMGNDGDDQQLRAGFSADGTLMRFGRGDDMGPGRGEHGKWERGERRDDGHHDGRHDGRRDGHGDRHGDGRGDGHGDKERHGPRGDKSGDKSGDRHGAALSDEAAAQAATAAGYTGPGAVTRDGPRTLIEAVNPQGESVLVELSPKGDVLRETAQ